MLQLLRWGAGELLRCWLCCLGGGKMELVDDLGGCSLQGGGGVLLGPRLLLERAVADGDVGELGEVGL